MSKEKTSTKNRYGLCEAGQLITPRIKKSSVVTVLPSSSNKKNSASVIRKTGKPSVRVVTIEELNTLERDTSETAKAIIKSMRATYKNTHGNKKVKSA